MKYSVRVEHGGGDTGYFVTYGEWERHAKLKRINGVITKLCRNCRKRKEISDYDYVLESTFDRCDYFHYCFQECSECRQFKND